MVTIYDVAKRAGVSPATVSRVFNGINVSPARADAVHRAAEELGFVRNRNARRLRMNSSEIIAMMVPDIENPFFSVMTRAVEDVVRAEGFSVMLCNTDEDLEREQKYVNVAVAEPVAGVISVPANDKSDFSPLVERQVPLVCVDRKPSRDDIDTVVADNVVAAAAATKLLFDAGYHRVACVTGLDHVQTADERLAGWAKAVLEVTGREPDPQFIRRFGYSVESGERATTELLALPEPPDAFFAANNRLAAGVIRVLSKRGMLPPTTGVVSFGGLPLVLLAPLGVLVTHLPARQLGLEAARLLLRRINSADDPAHHLVLPITIGDEESGLDQLDGASARS